MQFAVFWPISVQFSDPPYALLVSQLIIVGLAELIFISLIQFLL